MKRFLLIVTEGYTFSDGFEQPGFAGDFDTEHEAIERACQAVRVQAEVIDQEERRYREIDKFDEKVELTCWISIDPMSA